MKRLTVKDVMKDINKHRRIRDDLWRRHRELINDWEYDEALKVAEDYNSENVIIQGMESLEVYKHQKEVRDTKNILTCSDYTDKEKIELINRIFFDQ